MRFTAHNIALQNGHATMGNRQMLLANSNMWSSIQQTVDLFFPEKIKDRGGLRVVDLGCLEGGFAVEFAKQGYDTLGIEARAANVLKCNYAKDNLDLPNLSFVQDDVQNLKKYGKFDISLCYGLLYHLDCPVKFLELLSSCTTKLLILNTHFAPNTDMRYSLGFLNKYLIAPLQKRTKLFEHQQNYRLSGITTNEGYKGRWYREWSNNMPKEKVEKLLWASYSNNRSFWLCKKELTKALHAAGFDSVFEQFNFTGDLAPDNYTERYNRTMFVAIKNDKAIVRNNRRNDKIKLRNKIIAFNQ